MIAVTGGCGYIGSHTVVELCNAGESILVIDNLCNASVKSLDRIHQITNQQVAFEQVDLTNAKALDKVFSTYKIDTVIHFAALKSVAQSIQNPLTYYHNNVLGTINLLCSMQKYGIHNLVYSSSATVYGIPQSCPIDENAHRTAINPYGSTKIMVEDILQDICQTNQKWNAVLLRYFNPIGSHPSHLLGENPNGIPNNLMPYITSAVTGKLPPLQIFGGDYPTPDGTCIRDYIHIVDLARGHLAALNKARQNCGLLAVNLGTGKGLSVLQILQAFQKANGVEVPYTIVDRRVGDTAIMYADTQKAEKILHWKANLTIEQACKDHYQWQLKNLNGYDN